MERVVLNEVSMESARSRAVGWEAARERAGSTMLGFACVLFNALRVCESERAD